MRKVITILLICILATVACISGYKIFQILSEYHAGESSYEELKQYVIEPSDDNESNQAAQTDTTPVQPIINFDALSAVNSDVIAWIRLDNSAIDYPVVQCDDNDYYLSHLFDNQYNSSGAIFLDCRNHMDFSDKNSVIYGHHMKNGTMFSVITKYKNQSFYDEHPAFHLYTPNANYEIEVFAGYVADVQDSAWDISFDDDGFSNWVDERIRKSAFHSEVKPSADDKIVTLSTCSYEFEDARFVLFGVLHQNS